MEIKEIASQNFKYLIQTPPGMDLPDTLSPAKTLKHKAKFKHTAFLCAFVVIFPVFPPYFRRTYPDWEDLNP